MYYIVALGNPGKEYENTRHNVGFLVLEYVVNELGWSKASEKKFYKGLYTEGDFAGVEVSCLFPTTFMNNSGEAVKKLISKEESKNLIVIYDDIDLPLGKVRFSQDRGDGGHNGIKSIINHLGTKDFVRIRIGIAPINEETGLPVRPLGDNLPNFVLNKFSKRELEKLDEVKIKVKDGLEVLLKDGIGMVMNRFN